MTEGVHSIYSYNEGVDAKHGIQLKKHVNDLKTCILTGDINDNMKTTSNFSQIYARENIKFQVLAKQKLIEMEFNSKTFSLTGDINDNRKTTSNFCQID